ncbi:MAG: aryl-sulfate sulfotransferase [Blautia sp.]
MYDTKDYILHHDYVFDDEGDLLVLATDTQSDSVEDQILLLTMRRVEITMEFDLGDLLGDYKQSCTRSPDEELDWMHINSIQWLGDETVILSSRETSSILKISGLYSDPQIDYLIGEESFWEGTGYEGLLLKKNEEEGSFSNTGGQHTVTYESDEALPEGQYYLYLFNNNLGVSESQPEYDWSQIQGIATSLSAGENSYYYKYKVDESTGTYSLVQSFSVPFSGYVSSVQDYQGNIIVDSGMEGVFGEYDAQGNLLRDFKMNLSKSYIYRVYKYDFEGFYFEN